MSTPKAGDALPRGIREFRLDDLDSMTEIFNETALRGMVSAATRTVSLEEMTFYIDYFMRLHNPVYVLERHGEVIAWLTVSCFSWGGLQACRITGEANIYARDDAIGRGIGARMGRAAVILAERYGFETLVAWIVEGNHASDQVVQGMGAEKWGYFPGIARFRGKRTSVALYGLGLTPLEMRDAFPLYDRQTSAVLA
ncbi:GNAT family N-acetyltransferase [Pseudomonas matsuisoli]|uniref:N-acetyltransferase domain-containing protein n=1 Tax=Pseudomonas matsuisoli TaxID=1515666 RepID=A0A917PHW4_9PSED|nr:GNAT family N-acetyltransferase [Pseudomonas matsuisoli]GGJ78815.1 hypothetical protein GCM10009304_00880 [Pseudomonas matsuisoli]